MVLKNIAGKFKYTFKLEKDHLFVECGGVNTNLEELMVFSYEIMDQCDKGNVNKVLMDSRWLKVKISVFTKYEFSNRLMEIPFISRLQIAVAVGTAHWKREKDMELFLNNRSLPMYKIFVTLEEARDWLMIGINPN